VASASDAIQMYTRGTTGKPKGAVHTHASLAVQQRLLAETWGFGPGDVLLHALPLHHTHGLTIALLTAIGAGSALRMLPRFEAGAVWDAMAASSAFMAVPTMYAKLFAAYEAAGAATRARFAAAARGLRLATSGSAALPVALGERWRALAGTYPLERFGMTEIGVGASNPLGGERRPGTVGRVLPTFEARVVDDELWLAGPSLFSGYWRREQASAAAFVVDQGRRWLRTGDTVAFDPDGYLRILGRTSVDIIKSAGFKLSALEIEGALAEWGAAAEVAVVGAADETLGERVVACVVPSPGREQDCTLGALRAFAHDRLAAYKVPRELRLFATLPRNAMGKVVKPELARILRDGRAPQSG
jgi:malonyl-CoA/methylmalonyl-CoA synthetase